MNILEAIDDPNLFGPFFKDASWKPWRAALRALFALPMSDEALDVYRQCTGRSTAPTVPFKEAHFCVGRRGGKSRILATIAVFLACFRDYKPHLAPGEVATIAVLAANRSQARNIFRYISGLLKEQPSHLPSLLQSSVVHETTEQIVLSNRVVIEIGTASFRTTRGYSFSAILCDESCYWLNDETSANPEVEILRALRPGMATIDGSILLLASSPYAKRGEMYNGFRKYYGKDDARVLFWKAPTETMNSRVDPEIIKDAYETDPQSARAEYGAEFRDDLADFVSRETVDGVTMWGRHGLPPQPGIAYSAFADPSGGISDSFALAVGHLDGNAVCVLDSLTEIRAPFDPEQAVAECTVVLGRYGITRVTSDKYAGLWPAARFAENGILLEQSARPKSDIYLDFLALINSGRVELLDVPRLSSQLCGLERRTARSGRDTVDHGPGCKDDAANVVCGVCVGMDLDRRPALVRQADMLVNAAPLPPPAYCRYVAATLVVDKFGQAAVVYAARLHDGTGPALLLLDFEVESMNLALFRRIGDRVRELSSKCKAQGAVVFVYPAELLNHALAVGLVAEAVPEHVEPDMLLLSASNHVGAGSVKICDAVLEKSKTSTFGAALDFRASENADDPLRAAALLMIGLVLDIPA